MAEDRVSHEDLDRAAEAGVEATGVEATSPEVTPEETKPDETQVETKAEETQVTEETVAEEPEDHAERSALGRRVSNMERMLSQEMAELKGMLQKPTEAADTEEYDEETYLTAKQVDERIERRERRMQETANQYNNAYTTQLATLGGNMPETEYTEIINELTANHNVKRSNDPGADATTNFLEAQVAVLQKKVQAGPEKKIPVKGGQVNAPLGGPSDTKNTTTTNTVPKLDKYAAEFVKKVGMSDDAVREALKGDMPLYLQKGKLGE